MDGIITSIETTQKHGICSMGVQYTSHNGLMMHEAQLEHACAPDGQTVIPGCFNDRHPDTLYTDEDHLNKVRSFNDARVMVIVGTVLTTVAVVAVTMLWIWLHVTSSQSPATVSVFEDDSNAVPRITRCDSASEFNV